MDVFKTCKRRWYLEYYLRLRRKYTQPKIARDTGIVVHDALHQFYVLGGIHAPKLSQAGALAAIETGKDAGLARDLSEEERSVVEETFETAEILVKGYFKWLDETGADDQWTVTGSEEKIVVDGPVDDTEIKGYVDISGIHKPSGDLIVCDTKVVQNFGDMLKTLHINEQGPLYAVLTKIRNGENQNLRVIWNMIKRNKQTARAKPPFYQRYELLVNHDMLVRYYQQLHGQLTDMLAVEDKLNNGASHDQVAYPTPSRDCSWKCPFLAVCGAMNDPRTDVEWIINNNYEQIPA